MKKIFWIFGVAILFTASSCGSNNTQNEENDSLGMDTGYMDMDTTGVADTAGMDSMYRDSPARSDGSTSSSRDRTQNQNNSQN